MTGNRSVEKQAQQEQSNAKPSEQALKRNIEALSTHDHHDKDSYIEMLFYQGRASDI